MQRRLSGMQATVLTLMRGHDSQRAPFVTHRFHISREAHHPCHTGHMSFWTTYNQSAITQVLQTQRTGVPQRHAHAHACKTTFPPALSSSAPVYTTKMPQAHTVCNRTGQRAAAAQGLTLLRAMVSTESHSKGPFEPLPAAVLPPAHTPCSEAQTHRKNTNQVAGRRKVPGGGAMQA